jgi:hypothetical protein
MDVFYWKGMSMYIVMAPNAWGKSETVQVAFNKCLEVDNHMEDYDIWLVHPDTDVLISDEGFVAKMDETGTLSYPIDSENTPKLIKRVRKGKEVLVDAV